MKYYIKSKDSFKLFLLLFLLMHYIIKNSFSEMYPNKEIEFDAKLKYSKAFKGYNANVKFSRNMEFFEFRLSHKWKDVSNEIKMGIIQNLFNKVYGTEIKTLNIDMYNIFLKKLTDYVPVTKTDDVLEESFDRVNWKYFEGLMIRPNLIFGGKNVQTLGTYSYGTDTIMISRLLTKDQNLLDYVMYHEMLHKKLKYEEKNGRTRHHSPEFRRLESLFEDKDAEKKLGEFVRKHKFRGWF